MVIDTLILKKNTMIPDRLKEEFYSLKNMFDELKIEIDKNVVKEENYKGEFYEIAPYSYQRNRFKQGKIVKNITSLRTTNHLYTYYFNAKNQIIEIREGCELKDQFDYTFFIYEKGLMKTILYDNSKRIVNVCYYLYGSNGKIEKMYSKGTRGSREETYLYEDDFLQKIVIRQFDRNEIEQDTLQHSFDYKPNGELKSIILSTELYSETIYQET
ncbi:hypothetical protein [Phocaeicola dorei]|uniref:hypothetical protein n=2 Tax=Phocaeicola dorei TaxID=357276 RepID=UPI0022DFEC2E|nr:hypothetical protein [Phocaeicola dorei]